MLEGVLTNGVIVPDAPVALPEGTRFRLEVVPESAPETVGDRLNRLAERFRDEVHDLPADYSLNFEHYLYGVPKKS